MVLVNEPVFLLAILAIFLVCLYMSHVSYATSR